MDWAFAESVQLAPHDIHPYPARYIPEIPASALSLIEDLQGDVLDPFCGAGTTLVEATRIGRRSVGIDLNPIAGLISRVKTKKWQPEDDEQISTYVARLRDAAQQGNDTAVYGANESIPRLDYWFTAEAQHLLAGATTYARSIGDEVWRDRVRLAISASIVRLSRQDSDTRYAAVDRPVEVQAGAQLIAAALTKIAAQLRKFSPEHSGAEATVVVADARNVGALVTPRSVAAAVFSPPYPNAYEYWLYHKYRLFWLGYDPIAVRSSEIGARPFYSGSGRATKETFASEMRPVFDGIRTALVDGGICLVVVGDSLIRGELADNKQLLLDIAHDVGLWIVASTERPIRRSRKSFNLAVARASHEHVLLMQRP